ncbi:MAG TPA: type B 50S ribosomal protein L31 [Candidatus Kapabacteria bacterium]|nr:type B 50S ribosomal protein L31 [Candidatus Kapabacteria bacterium]
MQKKIHPEMHPVIFVDTSCGAEFVTMSTLTSEETRDVKGVKHYIINTEISSASHPFYTGKQILIDTARRVEKFEEKMKKVAGAAEGRKGKKVKKAKAQEKKKEKAAVAK